MARLVSDVADNPNLTADCVASIYHCRAKVTPTTDRTALIFNIFGIISNIIVNFVKSRKTRLLFFSDTPCVYRCFMHLIAPTFGRWIQG
jgi:hypothetical protein